MKKLYQEKNVEGALEDFEKAYQQAPKFYEALFQTGMAMLSMGKGAEAEAQFRKSLEISDNKFAGANVALGVLLFDRNDLEGAAAYFQHALELRPSAWIASYKMGEIAYRHGDLVQAERWAKQAKQSENESTMMDQLLLEIHVKQKNYPAAIQDIDAYLENDLLSETADRMRELQEKLKSQIEKSFVRRTL
jgi:tetratricopeptide (TPR) repeat protein